MERVILICNFENTCTSGMGKILTLSSDFVKSNLFEINEHGEFSANGIPKINSTSPFLFIKQDTICDKEFKDWQVLLVLDSYFATNKDELIVFFDANTFVMYHTTPPTEVFEAFIKDNSINVKGVKKGMHEIGEWGYPLLNYFVDAYDVNSDTFKVKEYNEALKKLIDWFNVNEKLEAALDFLHDCLGKNPENFDTSKISILFKNDMKLINDIIIKMPKTILESSNDNYSKYIESFKSLRDELLRLSGV